MIYYKKSMNWYSVEDLKGSRWITKKTNRTPIEFTKANGTTYISLTHPHVKIKPIVKNNEAKFTLDVDIKGSILELSTNDSLKNLEKFVQDYIKKDIEQTFEIGLKRNGDPLGLGQKLYRKDLRFWKNNNINEPKDYLHANSFEQININVNLANAGTLEYNPFKNEKLPNN
ncbi:Ger(x)C family spore germination C-terminal domain-containing protein [Peribacillus sp. TH16]|nr:Ger(x)C family spore germination C-terminal domain-containing protein [Peribacillus sp. TH16]